MAPVPKYTKDDLEKALKLIQCGSSVCSAAKAYSIPESTLRIKNNRNETEIVTKAKISYSSSVLTKNEERILYEWIRLCSERGYPRTGRQICNEAYRISVAFPRAHKFPNNWPSRQ